MFLRLRACEIHESVDIHALRAVSISNDLYRNDVISSHEMAKGFTKPAHDSAVHTIPNDVVQAQAQLQAKKKLALILKSNSVHKINVAARDKI